jgi:hypothetical protein
MTDSHRKNELLDKLPKGLSSAEAEELKGLLSNDFSHATDVGLKVAHLLVLARLEQLVALSRR